MTDTNPLSSKPRNKSFPIVVTKDVKRRSQNDIHNGPELNKSLNIRDKDHLRKKNKAIRGQAC
jgi:hypothetical protein